MARKKSASPSRGEGERANTATDVCFVIMPFGGWFDEYYLTVFSPAIQAAGLMPARADDLYRPSTIIHDVWEYTKRAKVILADLTSRNPNVFYELGLAHALAKPAVLLVENIEDVPFDLRALRVIEYNKNAPDWGSRLQARITSAIGEVLASPLESVLPAFLRVQREKEGRTVTPHEKEILELKQDIELLKRELRKTTPRTTSVLSSSETQREAARMIEELFRSGRSEDEIRVVLKANGIARAFVDYQLEKLRGGGGLGGPAA